MNNSAPTRRIFMKFDTWIFFENLSRKFKVSLKSNKNNGYFTWRPIYIFIISHSIIRRMRNVSGKSCTESQNTQSTISNLHPPRKSCRLWDKVGKMLSVGVAAEDNMAHAHFTLDTEGYKHTLRICNIYYFSQQWLHECASCCVKRTSVLFITSLCTNTQRIKSPKLLILRGFTIKTLHILPTSQGVPKFRPISIFISSPKQ